MVCWPQHLVEQSWDNQVKTHRGWIIIAIDYGLMRLLALAAIIKVKL